MRKASVLLTAIFVLLMGVHFSHAQAWRGKGRISGNVKDVKGNPIEGATVKFTSDKYKSSTQVTTDKKGNWVLNGVGSDNWHIEISKQGFNTMAFDSFISGVDYNKPLQTEMAPATAASTASSSVPSVPKGPNLAKAQEGRDLLTQKDYKGAIADF